MSGGAPWQPYTAEFSTTLLFGAHILCSLGADEILAGVCGGGGAVNGCTYPSDSVLGISPVPPVVGKD